MTNDTHLDYKGNQVPKLFIRQVETKFRLVSSLYELFFCEAVNVQVSEATNHRKRLVT